MNELKRISRDPPTNSMEDYSHLYRTGIARAQELAGETWTDYNDHDPGVTILQQLCYALTDLAYRTEHPIEDILAPAPGEEGRQPRHTFYTGEKILTCNPLTINDYRKIVYDRIGPLRNAWFRPAPSSVLKGLYDVRLQPWHHDPPDDQSNSRELRSNVIGLLRKVRNLGEDFDSVTVLKPLQVVLEADVEIGFEERPEDIVANILFEIGNELIPFPVVANIDTKFQAGVTPDTIFVGPQLTYGAIDDRHLEDLPPAVTLEKILGIVRNSKSVLNVRNLKVTTRDEAGAETIYSLVPPKPIILPKDHVPFLNVDSSIDGLTITRDGSEQSISQDGVRRSFNHLVRLRLDRELYARRRMHDIDYRKPPWGRYRDVERYTSIQHQFPVAYGIGNYGVPDLVSRTFSSDPEMRSRREAQAKQLKAYLLFFEQMLANYLSQLAGVQRLFSLDPTLRQTYFWQEITDPPDITSVLGWVPAGSGDESEGESHEAGRLEKYRRGLEEIINRHDPFLDRRERILDHLLARFNERFEDNRLELLRHEQRRRRYSGDRDKVRVRWKREFLKEYVSLSRDRGTGIDYSIPAGYGIGVLDKSERDLVGAEESSNVILRSRHNISSQSRRNERRKQILQLGVDVENYRLSRYGGRLLLVDETGEVVAYATRAVSSEGDVEAAAYEVSALIGRIAEKARDEQDAYLELREPSPCSLEKRVSLLSGCTTDVYLLEHILLRPVEHRGSSGSEWPPEFYSLAASFFFSGWQRRFTSADYRQFAESVVGENCPAHIAIDCYWLSRDDMRDFKELYYDWRAAKADACTERWDEGTMRRHIQEQVEPLAESLKEFIHMQRQVRDRGDAQS